MKLDLANIAAELAFIAALLNIVFQRPVETVMLWLTISIYLKADSIRTITRSK